MYPKLIKAIPIEPLKLKLYYDNGEIRVLDMTQFMISNYFRQLQEWNYFKKVEIKGEVVTWPNEQDIAPETLYLESEKLS